MADDIVFLDPIFVTLPEKSLGRAPVRHRWHDGSKFYGGFGSTDILSVDYWTLRTRSTQLFRTNLYARGIIRRFLTNVINTGLHLEAVPEEKVLGFPEDGLSEWSENVETRFSLWEKAPYLCDEHECRTFGALQVAAYMEALVSGDCLVQLRQDRRTGLPRVKLIPGDAVETPLDALRRDIRIEHGVELDDAGRHVAYWVRQRNGKSERLPAWGARTGRRVAWLVYATEKRLDDVRGEPILSLVLQSIRELDRYRDATLRKQVINSMLAMFIKKTEERAGTLPITGGAVRRTSVTVKEEDGDRRFNVAEHMPGLVLDELQVGEEPFAFPTGTDQAYGDFEEAVVSAIAWTNNLPPEILKLAFSNNYSASQAAINEMKMFLNLARERWGSDFCSPIYEEWLLSQALAKKIDAPRLLESWRDVNAYDVFGSWVSSDWAGQIKPAVDLSKLVRGYHEMVEDGFITRDRATRELTGMKYSKVVKRLKLENEQLKEAQSALAPTPAEPAPPGADAEDDDADIDEEDDEEERAA